MNHAPTQRRTLSALLALAVWLSLPTGGFADEFGDYWYQGKAELSSYTLEQARYGEIHPGEAVLIFVTEDFSRAKHVKLDNPQAAGDDRVPVLKLNVHKTFHTGIYPYSVMSSIFSPVDGAPTLKTTTTSQEWCGHTFTQLNHRDDGYRVQEFSYFESEGDQQLTIDGAMPEDGIWNQIRLDPSRLPTGRVRLIPGTIYQRFQHAPWRPAWADATLRADPETPGQSIYSLTYPDLGRTLAIHFTTAFPHEIQSWEESSRSGYGVGAAVLTTRGTLKKRIMLDYWRHNRLRDASLRAELGLDAAGGR